MPRPKNDPSLPENFGKPYSKAHQKRLQWLWGNGTSLQEIAKELGRTPIGVLTYVREHPELGLDPVPRNMVSITEAARRCGMSRAKVARILKDARTRVEFTIYNKARPRGYKPRVRRVDWDKAKEVVEDYLDACSPLWKVAGDLGLHPTTLKRIMVWAGHTPPEVRNRPWHIDIEDAREAIEMYAQAKPVYAKRLAYVKQLPASSSKTSKSSKR